jgi:Phage integrase, N-terminal SAM-like domain
MKPDFRATPMLKHHSISAFPPLQSKKILDQVRERVRYLHYSIRTEEAYLYWIRYFIRWAGLRHPHEMGAEEVRGFGTGLNDMLSRVLTCQAADANQRSRLQDLCMCRTGQNQAHQG